MFIKRFSLWHVMLFVAAVSICLAMRDPSQRRYRYLLKAMLRASAEQSYLSGEKGSHGRKGVREKGSGTENPNRFLTPLSNRYLTPLFRNRKPESAPDPLVRIGS
jgi:hypothetical protein